MPRPLRIQEAGYVHHVVCRGNDRQEIFKYHEDFLKYFELIKEARQQFPVYIYNYVLMNNHVHLLIEPGEDGSLSRFMEYVSKGYAKYFNKKHDHIGHVFQGRFKSFLIQTERYFFTCSRYIDLNPVKAALTHNPAKYQWSGYRDLALGKVGELKVDMHDIYRDLGRTAKERQAAYRTLVQFHQGEELDLLNRRAGDIR